MKINSIQKNYNTPSFGQVLTGEVTDGKSKVAEGTLTNGGKEYSYYLSKDAQPWPIFTVYALSGKSEYAGSATFKCGKTGSLDEKPYHSWFVGGSEKEHIADSLKIIKAYRRVALQPVGTKLEIEG